MTPDLKWSKVKLDPGARSALDRAIAALGRRLGQPYCLARLPHGRILACRVDDFWFCRAGPSKSLHPHPVLVDTRPEPRTLLPLDDEADFAECCDLLGLRTDEEQAGLRTFLITRPTATAPNPASGAP